MASAEGIATFRSGARSSNLEVTARSSWPAPSNYDLPPCGGEVVGCQSFARGLGQPRGLVSVLGGEWVVVACNPQLSAAPNPRLQLTGAAVSLQEGRGGRALFRGFRRPQLKRKPLAAWCSGLARGPGFGELRVFSLSIVPDQ